MLLVAASPELDHHDVSAGHPERKARVGAALDGIAEAGLEDAVIRLDPRRATESELTLVHPKPHLDALRQFCESGGGHLDPDTVAAAGSWDTALLSAGAVLEATDALEEGRGEVAFVCERPPGHHATAGRAMGFCLLNNIAVGAANLANRGERVLVVDWDVHHGNGTQDIFWDDPRVMYVSTHQWPLYPGTGRADETGGAGAAGKTVNVPLPPGATGDVLLEAMDDLVAPLVEGFAPSWVLVSAGFDAHRADMLANLSLSAGDFADLAARVRRFVPGPGRLVFVLEGGYDLDALRLSVGATLSSALGERFRPEPASCGGPGADSVAATRRFHEL